MSTSNESIQNFKCKLFNSQYHKLYLAIKRSAQVTLKLDYT